jgi:glycosidase
MEFWDQARAELDKIKPVFMLAEAERPALHYKAFDASYGWELHHIMHKIAIKEKKVSAIDSFFMREAANYNQNAIRMQFITNHDENSWNGTVKEKFGVAANVFAVLTYTVPGMPLIYSGQEAGLDKRLKFFEKDQIDWNKDKDIARFYKSLNELKKQNPALWNGDKGAPFKRIITTKDSQVFAFLRETGNNKVLVITNLSDNKADFSLGSDTGFSDMKNYFDGNAFQGKNFLLKPWEYRVYVK